MVIHYPFIMEQSSSESNESCALCALCALPGGESCWEDAFCRVVIVQGRDGRAYPGTCRVIWKQHVAEMTDLDAGQRRHFMDVVFATEAALRQLCQPHKINLASLGNVVPHLHWHVIPRYRDDAHFPAPIWAAAERQDVPQRLAPEAHALRLCIATALAAGGGNAT